MSVIWVVSEVDTWRYSVRYCRSTHPCRSGESRQEHDEDGWRQKGVLLSSVSGPHGFVVNVCMGFGGVISIVGRAGPPEVAELPLGFAAA